MTDPKARTVSVVIPVFNQVHWTERCLDSLLHHSEMARDLILIDNHSTDTTPAVLARFKPEFEARGWRKLPPLASPDQTCSSKKH